MADKSPGRALEQVRRIESICDFMSNRAIKAAVEQSVPVSMPAEAGSLGFDSPLWVGLGMVGLWAALDAFAERADLKTKCSTCERQCIVSAYAAKLSDTDNQTFAELEDLRHLYAHNYAGVADEEYFNRPRHVLKRGDPVQLSCGALFDGHRLCRKEDIARVDQARRLSPQYALNLDDLRKYSRSVRSVLERFP